jgi:hypothetical protein
MALTRPAAFSSSVDQGVTQRHLLLRFVIGSDSRMFADCPILIADGLTSYNASHRLKNAFDLIVREAVNLHECTFEIPSFVAEIDNTLDPGTLARPSDEWSSFWTNIMSGYVELYAVAGMTVTGLSDCLKIFKGRVAQVPEFDASVIRFEIEGYARAVHQGLPTTLVSDLGGTATSDNDKRLPLAYGEFITEGGNVGIYSADRWGSRVGRVRAVRTKSNRFYLHNGLTNLGEFWVKKKNGQFIRITTPTITADGNKVYCDIGDDITPIDGYLYIHPTGVNSSPISYGTGPDTAKEYFITGGGFTHEFDDGSNEITDATLAWDKDGDTFATLSAGVHFYQNNGADHDVMEKAQLALSLPSLKDGSDAFYAVVEALLAWKAGLKTITGSPTIKYGTTDASDPWKATEVAFVASGGYVRDFASDIYDGTQQTLDISAEVSNTDFSGAQIQMLVYLSKELSGGADPGSYGELLDIYEAYVRCKIQFLLEPDDELWYGGFTSETHTDIASRGGNTLSPTDTNKYPGFIAEQILRNELGVVTADIDVDAFDALDDLTVVAAVAVDGTEVVDSLDLLQEISENSHVMYYMTAIGQHSLLARYPAVPGSVDATIHRSECADDPAVGESGADYLVNEINIQYDYDRENKKHRATYKFEDATSQTKNGVRVSRPLTLRFLDKTLVEDTGSTFMDCIAFLYHDTRAKVSLQLIGWEKVHLEIGDWFSLDSVSIDPAVKFRGSSWSGVKFYITAITKRFDGVDIEGIRVT